MEKGYYRCVYVTIRLKKQVGVDSKEEQLDVEDDPDEGGDGICQFRQ